MGESELSLAHADNKTFVADEEGPSSTTSSSSSFSLLKRRPVSPGDASTKDGSESPSDCSSIGLPAAKRLALQRPTAPESRKQPLTLRALATAASKRLRSRLLGLHSLPQAIIQAIVEGSSRDELLAIEANNPEVIQMASWDLHWKHLCVEAWPPHVLATKAEELPWRQFYVSLEKDSKEKLKIAAMRCRNRLEDLKTQRAGLVVLEDAPSSMNSNLRHCGAFGGRVATVAGGPPRSSTSSLSRVQRISGPGAISANRRGCGGAAVPHGLLLPNGMRRPVNPSNQVPSRKFAGLFKKLGK